MAFISFRTKKESEKCFDCKYNYMNNFKVDQKGYVHFLEMEENLKTILRGTMTSICAICPYREKFEKMYGKTPVEYFTK